MPKSEKKSSRKQDDHPESDSVYDFLYQDVRRVGSYLAQLIPTGHVHSVKQTVSTEERGGIDSRLTAAATAVVARASGEFALHTSNANLDILERTFDPLWTNAIDLLNLLEDRNLIQRDIAQANIGQFVVISGTLGILDAEFLKIVWDVPELRTMLEKGMASSLQVSNASDLKGKNNLSKLIVKLFISLPKSIQVRLVDEAGNMAYCTVLESNLISTTAELFLKHGIGIPGEWAVLGILDAQPGPWLTEDTSVLQKLRLHDSGAMAVLLQAVQGLMREAGRPSVAYGMTPLLIFRRAG